MEGALQSGLRAAQSIEKDEGVPHAQRLWHDKLRLTELLPSAK
jgi:hypothetical protein